MSMVTLILNYDLAEENSAGHDSAEKKEVYEPDASPPPLDRTPSCDDSLPGRLLLVAPVFVVLGAFSRRDRGWTFLQGALILMLLGTVAIFLARWSGETSAQNVERTPAIAALIEQHEEMADATSVVFAALTAIFAAIVYGIRRLERTPAKGLATVLPLVFLILYGAGAALLIGTAHRGGHLVHEFGVHALSAPQG